MQKKIKNFWLVSMCSFAMFSLSAAPAAPNSPLYVMLALLDAKDQLDKACPSMYLINNTLAAFAILIAKRCVMFQDADPLAHPLPLTDISFIQRYLFLAIEKAACHEHHEVELFVILVRRRLSAMKHN